MLKYCNRSYYVAWLPYHSHILCWENTCALQKERPGPQLLSAADDNDKLGSRMFPIPHNLRDTHYMSLQGKCSLKSATEVESNNRTTSRPYKGHRTLDRREGVHSICRFVFKSTERWHDAKCYRRTRSYGCKTRPLTLNHWHRLLKPGFHFCASVEKNSLCKISSPLWDEPFSVSCEVQYFDPGTCYSKTRLKYT
jgi:predicted neuraminidase